MQNQRYFRLQELLHHYNITSDQIRYHIEQNQLCFSFFLEATSVLVGKLSGSDFIGYGQSYIKGLVSIGSKQSKQLFNKQKVSCKYAFIREVIFENHGHNYPFSIETPNAEISEWLPYNVKDLPQTGLSVKRSPRMQPSTAKLGVQFFEFLKTFGTNNEDIPNPMQGALEREGEQTLYSDDFVFTKQDACILVEDLVRLDLLGQNSASKPYSTWPNTITPSEAPNPNRLDQRNIPQFQYPNSRSARLAERLIGYAPDEKSDALWSIVRKAMRDDELLDLIDPEREVLEITPDTLFWNVPDTAPTKDRKLSRTSFKNTVSKVKKKLS